MYLHLSDRTDHISIDNSKKFKLKKRECNIGLN